MLKEWGEDPQGGNGEHCNVPHGKRTPLFKGKPLASWLGTQRGLMRKGLLKSERLKKLQELVDDGKLQWNFVEGRMQKWNEWFALLVEWGNDPDGGKGKDCNVPQGKHKGIYKGENLGSWLHEQRLAKRSNVMNDDRSSKLQELVDAGKLYWDPDNDSWEFMFALLLKWLDDPEEGKGEHCNVPQKHYYKGKRLGGWLNDQRQNKKQSILNRERLAKLQGLVDAGRLSWEPSAELPAENLGNFGNFGKPRKPNAQ